MPKHVYLTPVPDNTSESIAFSSRNIPSTWSCLVALTALFLFCQSFQSKIPTQRKHTLSAPERSNEHLCLLPARCASAACLGRSPKVAARNSCGRKISDIYLVNFLIAVAIRYYTDDCRRFREVILLVICQFLCVYQPRQCIKNLNLSETQLSMKRTHGNVECVCRNEIFVIMCIACFSVAIHILLAY